MAAAHDPSHFDAFDDHDSHYAGTTLRDSSIAMPIADAHGGGRPPSTLSDHRSASPPQMRPPSSLSQRLGAAGDRKSTAESGSYPSAQGEHMPYISEEYDPYADPPSKTASSVFNDKGDSALVYNAAGYAGNPSNYQDLEYAEGFDPHAQPNIPEKTGPLDRIMNAGRYPLEQRIEAKKRGIGRQRYPIVVWALTVTMVAVFIYELVVNAKAQGTPVSFKPTVNPMLGPSESALIRVGARFPPCMKTIEDVPVTTQFPYSDGEFDIGLNDTANPPDRLCSIENICGFGGFDGKEPNQWWRFITPIFLHAGFVHILLNMLAQLTAAAEIEREMGSIGFFIVYFAAGIFGNVLGGNFSLVGVPSVGASGAIFGVVAVAWIDLFANWQFQYRPVRKMIFMIIELVIGVAIGYIPYVDNFAHLGGFLMGILTGMTLYPVISTTKRHKAIVWFCRIATIPLAVVLYVVLIRNFYTSNPYAACSGCRYLSCIPTSANNHCKGTGLTTFTTNGASSGGTAF